MQRLAVPMTPDYEQQKRRVRRLFDRWHKALGLAWWKIDLIWSLDASEFAGDENGYKTIAFYTARWEYRTATITFNMPLLEGQTDTELEDTILHELVHIPLSEMWPAHHCPHEKPECVEGFIDHRERVVCSLASAFRWVRQAGFVEGQRVERAQRRREAKKK